MAHKKKTPEQIKLIHALFNDHKGPWVGYDVKARMKADMLDPKLVEFKNGRYGVQGKSKKTGIMLTRIIG